MHMAFAFDVVETARREEPGLFDHEMAGQVRQMPAEAVDCEAQFVADLLGQGVAGLSLADMRGYLEHVADRRLARFDVDPLYGSPNRWRSWTCKTSRNCPTSSNAAFPPTRWA